MMSIIALNDSTRVAPKGKLSNEQVSGLCVHVNPSMQKVRQIVFHQIYVHYLLPKQNVIFCQKSIVDNFNMSYYVTLHYLLSLVSFSFIAPFFFNENLLQMKKDQLEDPSVPLALQPLGSNGDLTIFLINNYLTSI